MARLNEFPAPAESIDALKRRFVRQNREIARVNSMQSLRIRSLESEVSHLLSENVSLREQVITLSQEIERLEAAKMLHDGVYEIKSKLDAKLAELSHLSTDLGMLPRKAGKLCEERPESVHPARPNASEPDARPRMTESDSNAGADDGRLPAILEDKYYPRRTLEQQELRDLVQDNLSMSASPSEGSAEAGPPSPEQPEVVLESRIDNDMMEDPFLPPTLETRKRKKKSESAVTHEDSSASSERLNPIGDSEPAMKSGSKRKFSAEDDESVPYFVEEDDEFHFRRPSHSPRKQTESFEFARQDYSPTKRPADVKKNLASPTLARRKVLEPKSANVNLGSPKKGQASLLGEHKAQRKVCQRDESTSTPKRFKDVEGLGSKGEGRKTRPPRSEHPSQKEKRASRSVEKEEVIYIQPALPPEPTVIDLEEELTKMPGLSGAPSRPSRRQRAVVSYAEPNLRDKMRRPTSELIDAVGGARRSSSFQPGRESLSDDGERVTSEPAQSSNSRSQPSATVPADLALADQNPGLLSRSASSDLLTSVSRRKRKVSSATKENRDEGELDTMANEHHATAPSSILGAPNSRHGQGLQSTIETNKSVPDLPTKVTKEASAPTRQSRRHSSNQSRETGSLAGAKSPVTTSTSLLRADEGRGSLHGGVSPEDDTSSALDTRQARRGQRVAARRKSMML